MTKRHRPNILITGTPGTGKTTLCERVVADFDYQHINITNEVISNVLFEEYDEDLQTYVLDDDKLLNHIEDRMDSEEGGIIIDYHGCDFFPERWFDIVAVLTCDNTILYDRLAARGYSQRKIKNNIECEIFGVLVEEAIESYQPEVLNIWKSETNDDMDRNFEALTDMINSWSN